MHVARRWLENLPQTGSISLYGHRDRTDFQGRGAQDGHLDFDTAPELRPRTDERSHIFIMPCEKVLQQIAGWRRLFVQFTFWHRPQTNRKFLITTLNLACQSSLLVSFLSRVKERLKKKKNHLSLVCLQYSKKGFWGCACRGSAPGSTSLAGLTGLVGD